MVNAPDKDIFEDLKFTIARALPVRMKPQVSSSPPAGDAPNWSGRWHSYHHRRSIFSKTY